MCVQTNLQCNEHQNGLPALLQAGGMAGGTCVNTKKGQSSTAAAHVQPVRSMIIATGTQDGTLDSKQDRLHLNIASLSSKVQHHKAPAGISSLQG